MKYLIILSVFCSFMLLEAQGLHNGKDNDNWPCYLRKCNKTSPDFDNCLLNHANHALPMIFPGDDKIGARSLLPFIEDSMIFGSQQTFKIRMTDVKIWGLNYLEVSSMKWDFANNNILIHLTHPNVLRINAKFTSNGTFNNRSMDMKGCTNFVYGHGDLVYNLTYTTSDFNGNTYANHGSCSGSRQNEFVRYNFLSLSESSIQNAETNRFFEENADDFDKAVDLELKQLLCQVVSQPFIALFYAFSLETMFA